MNILKTAIFTACIIGIVKQLYRYGVLRRALKKQLKIILTMILILGFLLRFLGGGFKLDLNAADKLVEQDEYENLNENFQEIYLNQSSENIENVLTGIIKATGESQLKKQS